MERVQFQQEQMLAELKDLVHKGLFTATETKQIMKKRTAFETALVRRVAKKSDFVRYAAYEMGLEQLRRKRVERLQLPPSPPSVSDYALVRRQFHIFERALKKFKSDVGLWIQYVEIAKREGARALVGRITARALQLHPNTPALYILAASHELSHLSPSAARTLLQRGIRLNSDSVDMWREYVKMELGFIEGLRRRWDILGIDVDADGKGKEKAKEMPMDLDGTQVAESAGEQVQLDDESGDATRKAIMDGAIIISVISSAAKSLPKIELFIGLQSLITTYPSPPTLRERLLDHLLDLLRATLPDEPLGLKLIATRSLKPDLNGPDLIEALKSANETLLAGIQIERTNKESFFRAYAEFVEEWCRAGIDSNLKLYLISCLRSLAQREHTSPSLSAAHIRLLLTPLYTAEPGAEKKVLKFARKYTTNLPQSGQVWLARLHAEKRFSSREEVEHVWTSARSAVRDTPDEVNHVWLWGLEQYKDTLEVRRTAHERLLHESMRDSSRSDVHEILLIRYATMHVDPKDRPSVGERVHAIRQIAARYLATARVWQHIFHLEKGSDGAADALVLHEVFEMWQKKDGLEATVAWAQWLLMNGRGTEAISVVVRARSVLKETDRMEMEKRWTSTMLKDRVEDSK